MRYSILVGILVCGAFACAQRPFSLGVIIGASLTGDVQNQNFPVPDGAGVYIGNASLVYSTPKRWILGGTVEAHLPFGLSFEADALYHELGFTQALYEKSSGTLNSVSPATVVTWEFPVLAKYRFSFPLVKPFVDAGPAFRSAGNLNNTNPSDHGFAAGLGSEVRVWKLRVAPQFRYLRWAHDQKSVSASTVTVPNQIEFLAAITY
jgi:hypothetical protein